MKLYSVPETVNLSFHSSWHVSNETNIFLISQSMAGLTILKGGSGIEGVGRWWHYPNKNDMQKGGREKEIGPNGNQF